jgi:type IV secretory pathway VirB2 component (pilin)
MNHTMCKTTAVQSATTVAPQTAPDKTTSSERIALGDGPQSLPVAFNKARAGCKLEARRDQPGKPTAEPKFLLSAPKESFLLSSFDLFWSSTERKIAKSTLLALVVILFPLAAHAQGSPFDTGFNAIQALFTGTIAKVASLVAIVIGGYGFAHGEPGAKKALAGVAAGTGIAVLAVNVLSWLWGV